jgi:hypothetical protein
LRNLLLIFLLVIWPQSEGSFPPLGVIDFYGLRTVPESQIRQALNFHEGDSIDFKQFESERQDSLKRIRLVPGVRGASLSLVCCTSDQKSMIYVGIEEADSPCVSFGPVPDGRVRLTDEVIHADKELQNAWEKAVVKGDASEDDSQGHALSSDPALRALELQLIPLAEAYLANLKEVLRDSSDSDQRAVAAEVLGYVKDKQSVVPNLMSAMRDPSADVRNNAMRTLLVFSRYTPKPPGQKIQISPLPFIALLNSCIWTDRNKSAAAVAELTESRDPALLAKIREEALPSLEEMARWKSIGHAWSSLSILGRVAGLSDEQIEAQIEAGNREMIIAAARKSAEAAH